MILIMFPQIYHQELMHYYLIYITEHDVKDILQTLKIGKACGDDGKKFTHQMLKSTSETICIPLAIIFSFSLQKGIFPSTWKIA